MRGASRGRSGRFSGAQARRFSGAQASTMPRQNHPMPFSPQIDMKTMVPPRRWSTIEGETLICGELFRLWKLDRQLIKTYQVSLALRGINDILSSFHLPFGLLGPGKFENDPLCFPGKLRPNSIQTSKRPKLYQLSLRLRTAIFAAAIVKGDGTRMLRQRFPHHEAATCHFAAKISKIPPIEPYRTIPDHTCICHNIPQYATMCHSPLA